MLIKSRLVPREGVEPPTLASSGQRSTAELPRRLSKFAFQVYTNDESESILVGAPGIEPGPYAPKAYILPLYYAPFDKCCSLSLSYYNEIVDKVNPVIDTRINGYSTGHVPPL